MKALKDEHSKKLKSAFNKNSMKLLMGYHQKKPRWKLEQRRLMK
jgi:hypothetical protein